MNVLRPRLRCIALAGLLAASPVALTPALAAKADVALLKRGELREDYSRELLDATEGRAAAGG